MRLIKQSRSNPRSGMESLQGVWVLLILVLFLSSAYFLVGRFFATAPSETENHTNLTQLSDGSDSKLLSRFSDNTFLIGIVIAVVGWAVKESLILIDRRISMILLDVLSDDERRTFDEVVRDMNEHPRYQKLRSRFPLGSIEDALANLVVDQRVIIDKGRYFRKPTN